MSRTEALFTILAAVVTGGVAGVLAVSIERDLVRIALKCWRER